MLRLAVLSGCFQWKPLFCPLAAELSVPASAPPLECGRIAPVVAGIQKKAASAVQGPLLLCGSVSVARKAPLPRGVAAFRSVRHVDEEFEPAFGFDLRHGHRAIVRCLGLVCGLSYQNRCIAVRRPQAWLRVVPWCPAWCAAIPCNNASVRGTGCRRCRSSYPLSRQNNIPLPHRAYRRTIHPRTLFSRVPHAPLLNVASCGVMFE